METSKKITIVHKENWNHFNSPATISIFNQYFDFEIWNPNKQYTSGNLCLLDCNVIDNINQINSLSEQGLRVVIDNLWEPKLDPVENAYILSCDNWFWYYISLLYRMLKYDQYQPCRQPTYLALMPIRHERFHRTVFFDELGDLKDRMIWSYVAKGHHLPGDCDPMVEYKDNYFNPAWYDQTYMNVVLESTVDSPSVHTPVFITEKTFKPIAFMQPAIIYGHTGTLARLKHLGFATFDNIWDESYDTVANSAARRFEIISLLKTLKIQSHDNETMSRLIHNHHLFYNFDLIQHRIRQEIIQPLIEYAETR
jgi:hypothetical protein